MRWNSDFSWMWNPIRSVTSFQFHSWDLTVRCRSLVPRFILKKDPSWSSLRMSAFWDDLEMWDPVLCTMTLTSDGENQWLPSGKHRENDGTHCLSWVNQLLHNYLVIFHFLFYNYYRTINISTISTGPWLQSWPAVVTRLTFHLPGDADGQGLARGWHQRDTWRQGFLWISMDFQGPMLANNPYMDQLIGLREELQEDPMIFMEKSMVSGFDFPLSQPIDLCQTTGKWWVYPLVN